MKYFISIYESFSLDKLSIFVLFSVANIYNIEALFPVYIGLLIDFMAILTEKHNFRTST